jgi:HEAT repeat protein
MRRFIQIQIAMLVLIPVLATAVWASIPADYDTVRLMLTAPDNLDLSMFDQESLIPVLVDIALNDDPEAAYHDPVVTSALKWLGSMHVPEAVEPLIGNLSEYPTTCVYWLGTYASADAVNAIVPMLDSDDASVRYEAAVALSTLPVGDPEDEAWMESLTDALERVTSMTASVQTDQDFTSALSDAAGHLSRLLTGE